MVFYRLLSFIGPVRGFHKRMLIYGAGKLGQTLFHEISNSPKLRIIPVGFIDDDPEKQGVICYQNGFNCNNGLRVLGTGRDITTLAKSYEIDEVCIAISNIQNKNFIKILNGLKNKGFKISLVPNLFGIFLHRIKLCQISNIPLIQEKEEDQVTIYLHVKQVLDIILAVLLLLLLWPLFLLIGLAVKYD